MWKISGFCGYGDFVGIPTGFDMGDLVQREDPQNSSRREVGSVSEQKPCNIFETRHIGIVQRLV